MLATFIAVVLTQTISRPVSDLERGMGAVADGDFSYRLAFRADRADEFGRLAESFQTMSSQLAQLDHVSETSLVRKVVVRTRGQVPPVGE